jgi:hypothetical protein
MKKAMLVFLYIIAFIMLFPVNSSADTGPKPSLTIIVNGMGDEEYWLDLLVSDEPNYTWLDISDEEREKVSKLAEYNEAGLHPALLVGTHVPMNGSLTGERQADGSYIHKFSYVGVPAQFKIAILKSDGTLIISDMVKRNHFQSVMEYTIGTSGISEKADPNGTVKEVFPMNYIWGFLLRMIATLIIEIGIALLFKFTLKKSWKVLAFTNIATQIILNIIIISSTIRNGQTSGFFIYFIAELFVVTTELAVYSNFLIEQKLIRRIIYTITANLISFIAGFALFFLP